MAMTLALAFGFALVPSTHETAYADLPALSNVQLVGDTLSWDAFTGATRYQVQMVGHGGNGSKYYTTNSADLSAIAADYHCETDTYDWYVYAVDEHDNQISLTSTSDEGYSTDPEYDYNVSYAQYSYENTQTRLSTPTGLVWNHTTLMWDGVDGVRSYSLTVYKEDGDVFVTNRNIFSGTSYSWTGFQTDTSYYFTIKANAPFGGDYCNSLKATSGTHTFASVVADLDGHVSIANGQLSISDVEGLDNCSYSIWSSDRTASFGGGSYFDLPIDLYTEFATLSVPDGTYDIEIAVYNEYNEPLAPVYYYDDWTYDSSLAPQVLSGTVTVTGDLEYGETLTATVTDTNNTGTLTYRWYRSDPLEDWVILQNGTSNTFTLTKPCIGKSILVVVTSSVELKQIESAETDAVGAGAAAVEIVSVGGNPVSAELGPGEFTNGSFPMGHVGTPYSAQLAAEGGSGNYTWEVIVGSLASGLSLNSSTGLVSGTPTNTATGSITIKCTDADNTDFSDNVQLNFVVYADSWVPSIVTTTVDNAVVDQSYDFDLVVNSDISASIDWTVESGSLPTGLSLGKNGTKNGRLYGTPTTKGTYTFTLKAANFVGSDTQEYTIVVDERLTVSYVDAKYYLGDEIALTASVGNENVDWSIGHNTSAATVISSSGVLTIGADEAAAGSYIAVYATSKTNSNNVGQVSVYFTPKTAYSITVTGGTATDSSSNPIAKAAEDENVHIVAPELTGKRFREWTVEAGSAAVALADAAADSIWIHMPAGNVILKANYDTIIDSVSATFDAPVNGKHIDQTLTTGSPNYTATLTRVWQGTGFKSLTDTIYETGKEYAFFVQVAPASGYVIVPNNQLSVTLNGTALNFADDYIGSYSAWRIVLTAISDEIPHFAVTVTNGIASASLAQENDVVTITANAPASGFVFDKWTTEDGVTFASATSASTTFVMPAKAVTVSATYKAIPQFTVSFDAGGGTGTMSNELVNENDKFELPANLFVAPANKEFKCWSVGGVEKNVGDEITITADTTVTAVWKYIKVAVSFDAGEGTGSMAPQQVDKGSSYTLPANGFTAPDGKRFKSWSIGGNAVAAGASIIINNATIVTAVWEDLPTMHAVSFDANGGTGSKAAEQVEHGTYFTLPESPFTAPTGKEFAGWAFTTNGSKIEASTIQVNNDVTLYARWKDVATEPSQPTQPDEPSQPSQPTQPAEPSQPDTPASPTEPSISEDKGGLSGGAIAGIVVGSVAVAGIGGFAFLWFVIKKKKFADLIAIFKKK